MTDVSKAAIRKLAEAADKAAEDLRDALQEYFDDRSEKWQDGDAGADWQALIDLADTAQGDLAAIAEALV